MTEIEQIVTEALASLAQATHLSRDEKMEACQRIEDIAQAEWWRLWNEECAQSDADWEAMERRHQRA